MILRIFGEQNCILNKGDSDWLHGYIRVLLFYQMTQMIICAGSYPFFSIEIFGHRNNIDIECLRLYFLRKNFVSTKCRIYKGILASPRLLRRGILRGCREYLHNYFFIFFTLHELSLRQRFLKP